MDAPPMVSVIVPCRDEAPYIAGCLESILAGRYPQERLEVLVVDGMSQDGTRRIIEEYAKKHASIRLLDNPNRSTPCALNVGLKSCRGDVVLRMDAHAAYPRDYIPVLVEWLQKSGADAVGCAYVAKPTDESSKARAIALSLSHPFGVGNSYFRIGTSRPRWVDTVPFGCYRRDVFDRVGNFDEELPRNQDDEFNFRIIRNGGKILLLPGLASAYYVRDTFPKLWAMYRQYGYFKPLVARKIGRIMTLRQVVPATFLLALTTLLALVPVFSSAKILFWLLLGSYGVLTLAFAAAALPRQGFACAAYLCLAFPILHFSYGLGCLQGILDFIVLGRRPAPGPALGPNR